MVNIGSVDLWRNRYDDTSLSHKHVVAGDWGHAALAVATAFTYRALGVPASIWNRDLWWPIFTNGNVTRFEEEHGKDVARARYNIRKRAQFCARATSCAASTRGTPIVPTDRRRWKGGGDSGRGAIRARSTDQRGNPAALARTHRSDGPSERSGVCLLLAGYARDLGARRQESSDLRTADGLPRATLGGKRARRRHFERGRRATCRARAGADARAIVERGAHHGRRTLATHLAERWEGLESPVSGSLSSAGSRRSGPDRESRAGPRSGRRGATSRSHFNEPRSSWPAR